MRPFGTFLGRLLLVLIVVGALLWIFGPYEDADLTMQFDETVLEGGVTAYLTAQEARFDDIKPGVEKQVIWAADAEVKAPWSVLYIHGFSASAQEVRPVPDDVARGLDANLIFTRLQGHGRSGAAMGQATVHGWMQDVAEGLAIARRIGDRVLIISTSTGGTLAAAVAADPALAGDVDGIVMISPNFGVHNPIAALLTWPAARYWLPVLAGSTRTFEAQTEQHGVYWTTSYASVATLPMGALIKAVDGLDLSGAMTPALFIFSDADKVVRPDKTHEVAAEWGAPVTILNPDLGPQDDEYAHVIAGDILSPGQTASTGAAILNWVRDLE